MSHSGERKRQGRCCAADRQSIPNAEGRWGSSQSDATAVNDTDLTLKFRNRVWPSLVEDQFVARLHPTPRCYAPAPLGTDCLTFSQHGHLGWRGRLNRRPKVSHALASEYAKLKPIWSPDNVRISTAFRFHSSSRVLACLPDERLNTSEISRN